MHFCHKLFVISHLEHHEQPSITFESKQNDVLTSMKLCRKVYFDHWGRVTHICVGELTTIDIDNGLLPGRRQAIIWTNAGILLIGPLGINFSEILIEIHFHWRNAFQNVVCEMLSISSRLQCINHVSGTAYSQNSLGTNDVPPWIKTAKVLEFTIETVCWVSNGATYLHYGFSQDLGLSTERRTFLYSLVKPDKSMYVWTVTYDIQSLM